MTDKQKVRLMIGDTIAGSEVFTDTEIDFFITETSSLNLAAAMALEAWMAKYTTNPNSEHIGDYSYTQKIVENMNKLRNEYIEKDASTPHLTWAEMNLTGITEEDD